MHSDDFEALFARFLERNTYDEANGAIFKLVREAFEVGFQAGLATNNPNLHIVGTKKPTNQSF